MSRQLAAIIFADMNDIAMAIEKIYNNADKLQTTGKR